MNKIKLFFSLIMFLLTPFIGFEDTGDDDGETKTIDDALDGLNKVLKSKTNNEVREMLKDPDTRNMIMKAIDEEEGEDDDDEEEEEEAPAMKKKKKAKAMKKSTAAAAEDLDNIIDDNEEVIDAVPVLQALTGTMQTIIKSIDKIESKINDSLQKSERQAEITEALAEVVSEQAEMVKSIEENIELFGEEAGDIPGMEGQQQARQTIQKSQVEGASDLFKSVKSLGANMIKSLALQGVKDKKINMLHFSKFEQDGSNLKHFTPNELNYINNQAGGNE